MDNLKFIAFAEIGDTRCNFYTDYNDIIVKFGMNKRYHPIHSHESESIKEATIRVYICMLFEDDLQLRELNWVL